MSRWIAHVDMDSFFVSVERLKNPSLTGKPVVVGGTGPRAVVASASYEARKFGVRSAMPMGQARRLSPQLVIVPPSFSDYSRISRKIFSALESVAPVVQQVSVDEAYLDFTGCEKIYSTWEVAYQKIREAVTAASSLTCSVGMATNKLLAKIASDINKPNGFCFVPPQGERAFLAPLPLKKIPGVGTKMNARLELLGLHSCSDLAEKPTQWVQANLGSHGAYLQALSQGIDSSEVHTEGDRKSLGAERTFSKDLAQREDLLEVLRELSHEVSRGLRREELLARTIQIKIRYRDFRTLTRAKTLSVPTHLSKTVQATATELFEKAWSAGEPVRLLGVSLKGFESGSKAHGSASSEAIDPAPGIRPAHQLSLFDEPRASENDEKVDRLRDELRKRFGKAILD